MIATAAFIIFIMGLIGLVVLSLAGRIDIALCFLVPLLPLHNVLYRFHAFPVGKDFVDIVLLAMVIGWVAKSLRSGEPIFESTPLNKLLFIFMGYSFVSLILGSQYLGLPSLLSFGDLRLQTWKNYMVLPLLYFITVNNVKDASSMRSLLVAMFLSLVIVDFYTARQIHYMSSVASRDRLVGTFVWLGPNQLAAFYVECFFVMLGLFLLYRRPVYRALFGGLLLSALGITLFLYSRGAYLALLTGLMLISMLKKPILILPLLLLVVMWQAVLPQTVIDRIKETRGSDGNLDSSSAKRLQLWKEGLTMFRENPISGAGFDVIATRGLQYGFRDTHNIFVKILAEQGMIGMAIFLMLLFLALKQGLVLYGSAVDPFLEGLGLGFAACVIGTVTTNLFGDRWTFVQIGAYFWVFLALVVRAVKISEEESAEEENYDQSAAAYQ